MSDHLIFFGWNRSIPGREKMSAAHFQDFLGYLTNLKQDGNIGSFVPVFLSAHGGDMNGFFLIQGELDQLNALLASEDWQMHMTKANHHLEGAGSVRGVTGEALMQQMNRFTSLISD